MMKSRHWLEDDGTILSEREHVLQMYATQRTLKCHKDELSTLFYDEVCCASGEGISEARTDGCQGLHAAWYNNHAIDGI